MSNSTDEKQDTAKQDDNAKQKPTDAGHSDADTQTQRNAEDESPS